MKSVRAFVTINHNKKLEFSSEASNEEINIEVEEYARNLVRNIEDAEYEVSWKWNQEVEAIEKAKEQIVVGAEFKGIDKTTKYVWKATITKVTPEKVYVLIKGLLLAYQYDCDTRHGVRYEEKTGTIPINRLVNFIRYSDRLAIDTCLSNKHYKKIDFIDVNGTPEDILKTL